MAESRQLRALFETIGSKATQKQYDYQLRLFQSHFKLESIESALEIEPKKLQTMLEDYVFHLKGRGLSKSYINTAVCALQGLITMNDVILNWPKIKRLYRTQEQQRQQDRPYTTDEIQRMLEATTSKRNKAVVLFLTASGVRVGALPSMKLKHLAEHEDSCKSVLVYAGTKEEYITFLTPEASRALDDYFTQRRQDGEKLGPESPLFRERYSIKNAKPQAATENTFDGIMISLLKSARIITEKVNGRYEVMRFHGFRKRFDTVLKLNKEINSNIIEKLMGHKKGLDGSYLKPTKEELFNEYRKGITDLTIDKSHRLTAQLQIERAKKTELEAKTIQNTDLQIQINELKSTVQNVVNLLVQQAGPLRTAAELQKMVIAHMKQTDQA